MKSVKNLKSIIVAVSILIFMMVTNFICSRFFEPKAYNYMVKNFSAVNQGSDEVVIVAIDDKSIGEVRWPWKREMYAKIFNYLNDYTTCKVIGFDAVISTPDKDNPLSDEKFYSAIKKIDKLVVGFFPLNAPYPSKIEGEKYDLKFKNKFGIDVKDERTSKYISSYQSLSKYPPQYFDAVQQNGSLQVSADSSDGYIKTVDQLINYKGTLYPSLSLRMYSYLNGNEGFTVKNNRIISQNSGLNIPVCYFSNGVYNYIHFYKINENGSSSIYSHKIFSAIDIVKSYDNLKQGKLPIVSPQLFEDKIVFVGANANAAGLEDKKPSPMLNTHPGVDIQATNLDNLLHNEFLKPIGWFQNFMIYLVLIAITFLIVRYFSMFAAIGLIAVSMIFYLVFCMICFSLDVAVPVITPLAFQIITMALAYSHRFILEGKNKEKIKSAMGKYISQDVMQNVVRNIDELKLGGKRANLTVLFADIRGFTSMSEKMSAEEVSVILNEYFTEIEPIISKYNGVINKFIGDAVMAIFGEPIQDKNHAENAVKCANEMLLKVEELQKKWLLEGKPKIEIGVGINTGEAFVGNIGSEKRLEYTVIGDMVNLASRIESYNKVYKTRFLISSSTYKLVRDIADVIKISEVTIRGKALKTNIYEVLRLVDLK